MDTQDIRALMPNRFILRPGVAPNRFTCRHPRHARCTCHGAAPPEKPAPPSKSRQAAAPSANPEAAHKAALQRLKDSYQRTLVQMLFAVRSFPDAAAAVQRILKAAPPDHQPDSEVPE